MRVPLPVDFDADLTEEGSRPAQATAQRLRADRPTLRPYRALARDLLQGVEELGRSALPFRAGGHQLPNCGGDGVGVEDALDQCPTIRLVRLHEDAGLPLAGGAPESEVGHAWKAVELGPRQPLQSDDDKVEQGAKNLRPSPIELVL